MGIRGFFARHRVLSAAVPPAALGVAAVIALPLVMSPAQDGSRVVLTTECHDMVTVSVAGRNDVPGSNTARLEGPNGQKLPAVLSSDYSSHWLDPVVNAPNSVNTQKPGSYAAVYVDYPANMATYEDAVTKGVSNAETVMREIHKSCPDTRFSVVGYSEGADVARRVAMDVGHQQADASGKYDIVDPANVVGVVILADNGRGKDQGPFPGANDPHSNPDGFDTKYQNGTTPAADGHGVVPNTYGDDFGALNGKVAAFCSDGDLTCSAPENISLLRLAANVGRQLNVDALEKDKLTPATGQDVATVLSRVAFAAFGYIQSTPGWMQSDETFLDVLLKVSDPSYTPAEKAAAAKAAAATPVKQAAMSTDEMAPLAYLPQKILKEIVGLIVTNQNTIPVILSDPYKQTLAPGTGHHFDYWHNADAAAGRPLSSAEYAAAWLTHLAQQAQSGQPVDKSAKPDAKDVAAAFAAAQETSANSATAPGATTPPSASAADQKAPSAAGDVPADRAASPQSSDTSKSPAPETTTNPPTTTGQPPAAEDAAPGESAATHKAAAENGSAPAPPSTSTTTAPGSTTAAPQTPTPAAP